MHLRMKWKNMLEGIRRALVSVNLNDMDKAKFERKIYA